MGKGNRQLDFRVWAVHTAIAVLILAAIAPANLRAQDRAPHANQIAFASNRDGDFEVYLMDADTGEIFAQLTDNTANDIGPTWSPDGTHIAFASDVDGDYEIYSLDVETGESINLTNNTADDLYPAWSPNGRQIAFTTNRDRNWEIYAMDTSGKGLNRLTNEAVYDGNPSWSPNGGQIVFVVGRDKDREISVMNADGSNIRQITNNNVADYGPVWSPDTTSDLIAFVSSGVGRRPDIPSIYTVDLLCLNQSDGCQDSSVILTPEDGGVDPAWSPDGSRLVFVSGRDGTPEVGNSELYIMDANGGNVRRLTDDPNDDRFPAWWSAQK